MKKMLILLITMFLAINLNAQVEPVDTDGNGFRNVSTLENLRWISENDTSWSFNYELNSDINAADTKNWNGSAGWKPIGTEAVFFSGKFDGKGHKIDSLYINRPAENYVGFFGIVFGKNIEITKLGITNSSITGKNYVGGLVGRNSYCSIKDCFTSGNIIGSQYSGGHIGKSSYAAINNSFSSCKVTGSSYTGGLIAYVFESNVNDCFSDGVVAGKEFTGGISGFLENSFLNNSYSSCSVTGTNKSGGIVGYSFQSEMNSCYSSSTITGPDYVGGLAGNSDNSTIKNSFFSGRIDGKNYVGGLTGWNDGPIENCYTKSSEIKGIELVGGLIGENDAASVLFCYSESVVSGSESVGGLIGRNGFGKLFGSYSKDSVSGNSQNIGGCVGWNEGGYILNCYSTCSISGQSDVGGIVGDNDGGMVHNSYSAGIVSGTGQNIGGVAGWNGSGKVINSFWDKEKSGVDESPAGIGKTTSEMKTINTYTKYGWNYAALWRIDKDLNNGYPFFENRTYPKTPAIEPVDSDSDGYINIKCFSNMVWISENVFSWGFKFELDNNINADSSYYWNTNLGFSPIGTSANHFRGQIEGNGYTLDSLYIYRPTQEYIGLLGFVDYRLTEITNIGLTDCSINGGNFTGAIVGWNHYGNIYKSYVTGSVSSFGVGGGLVGDNIGGFIMNCYSRALVTGVSDIGGLVGWADDHIVNGNGKGLIRNCYSTGIVTGGNYTGGLVGWNKSTVVNSFWDSETSGKSTSDGGDGRTSAVMKAKSTFTDVAWDFETIWDIDSQINDGYPILIPQSVGVIDSQSIVGDMLLSPNPATSVINLTLTENKNEQYSATIYDDYGQIVLVESLNLRASDTNNLTINIESLPTGAYTLILQSNSKRLMKRFAVVR
jgi:hypothetical protein